jgi:putative ABC transport system permease protein
MVDEQRKDEIESLPMKKILQIALQGIRIRIWRSLVVVSSIVLAIAFLTYILFTDTHVNNVSEMGSEQLVKRLVKEGKISVADEEDTEQITKNQRVQTFWMVGLALMISFVGIVNAMLMSVTERFREIGTMKCLGALDSFVLRLFLLESFMQGVCGTAVGVFLGFVLAYAEGASVYGNEVWSLAAGNEVSALIMWCFCGGVVLTVMGALYPAWQAAKMRPVVALRAEL